LELVGEVFAGGDAGPQNSPGNKAQGGGGFIQRGRFAFKKGSYTEEIGGKRWGGFPPGFGSWGFTMWGTR